MSEESRSSLSPAPRDTKPPVVRQGQSRRRTVIRWLKRGVLAVLAAALAASVIVAMLPKPARVDLAVATRGLMRVTVREDGKTRVRDRYQIFAPITGNMLRLTLRPGDAVDAGAVLARIVPVTPPLLDARTRAEAEARLAAAVASHLQAQAQVSNVRTGVEQAKRESERLRALAAQGAATAVTREQAEFVERARAAELAAAEFGVKVAAQAVASARAALGLLQTPARAGNQQLEIPAPVSGQVLRVLREDEGLVQAGTPLLELGDPASLEVVVDVLTADAVHIRPGAAVSIVGWGGERSLAAHVVRVEPSAFTRVSALGVEEQRVNVVIGIDEPREHWAALGDGFRVEAQIVLWESSDVLMVPASAVFRHGERWAVYVVENGTARIALVELGRRNDTHVQVLSGLDAGVQVVLHPSDSVTEGVQIEDRSAAAKPAT